MKIVLLSLLLLPGFLEAQSLHLENPGFEDELTGWTAPRVDEKRSQVTSESPHSGKYCLEVIDEDPQKGSELISSSLPASSGQTYQLKFWAKVLQGDGIGVYLTFLDSARKPITDAPGAKRWQLAIPASGMDWTEYSIEGRAPEGAIGVAVRVHSFSGSKVHACLDDFSLSIAP